MENCPDGQAYSTDGHNGKTIGSGVSVIEETPGSTPPAWTAGDALLLDFDGTLVEIAPRPDAVTVPLGLTDLLASLQERLQGALAIITGRLFSDIDVMLAPLSLSGVGLHGVEFRVPD